MLFIDHLQKIGRTFTIYNYHVNNLFLYSDCHQFFLCSYLQCLHI